MKFIGGNKHSQGFWIDLDDSVEWYGALVQCSECGYCTLDDGRFCSSCGIEMFNGRKDNQ